MSEQHRQWLEGARKRVTEQKVWEQLTDWALFLARNPDIEFKSDETGTLLQMWQDGAVLTTFDLVAGEPI